jgi:twinkle protein
VDNVIAVWRNKIKEKDRQANKPQSVTEPDEMLIVDKQRNGTGWEGYIGLWHHAQSMQFLAGHDAPVMEFFT